MLQRGLSRRLLIAADAVGAEKAVRRFPRTRIVAAHGGWGRHVRRRVLAEVRAPRDAAADECWTRSQTWRMVQSKRLRTPRPRRHSAPADRRHRRADCPEVRCARPRSRRVTCARARSTDRPARCTRAERAREGGNWPRAQRGDRDAAGSRFPRGARRRLRPRTATARAWHFCPARPRRHARDPRRLTSAQRGSGRARSSGLRREGAQRRDRAMERRRRVSTRSAAAQLLERAVSCWRCATRRPVAHDAAQGRTNPGTCRRRRAGCSTPAARIDFSATTTLRRTGLRAGQVARPNPRILIVSCSWRDLPPREMGCGSSKPRVARGLEDAEERGGREPPAAELKARSRAPAGTWQMTAGARRFTSTRSRADHQLVVTR